MNLKIILKSAVLLVITFIGILIFWLAVKPDATQTDDLLIQIDDNPYASLYIPSFTLLDSTGTQIDQSIMDGKYTVLDFFYTSCPLICPTMSAAMKEVQLATAGTDLQLLSISIDPAVDTPEVIARYAGAFDANPDRWRFATGNMEMITILLMGMSFDLGELSTDDGFRNIDHPARLILIGPDRHVIKLYSYADPDQLAELIKTARKLAS